MRVILKFEDKEIEVELSKEELQKLLGEKTDRSPFARRENGEKYYLIDTYGDVLRESEGFAFDGGTLRAIANYCADENLIQQQAYREILNRLLWRWQHENDEAIDWNDKEREKIYICCSFLDHKFFKDRHYHGKSQGTVYFSAEETADQAIKEVVMPFMKEHPDFVW